VKPAVEQAVADLRASFPDAVRVLEDADGGAFVIVDALDIGAGFSPSTSWVGFHITWGCPEPDVYPHFIDLAVTYVGSQQAPNQFPEGNLPAPLTRNAMMPGFNVPAIQVSRRSNRHNPATDTPLSKLFRVLREMRDK
jgi:hypothetical protein